MKRSFNNFKGGKGKTSGGGKKNKKAHAPRLPTSLRDQIDQRDDDLRLEEDEDEIMDYFDAETDGREQLRNFQLKGGVGRRQHQQQVSDDEDDHRSDDDQGGKEKKLSHRERRKLARRERKMMNKEKKFEMKRNQIANRMAKNQLPNSNNKKEKKESTAQQKGKEKERELVTQKEKLEQEKKKKKETTKKEQEKKKTVLPTATSTKNQNFLRLLREQGLIEGGKQEEDQEDKEIRRLEKLIGAKKKDDEDGLDQLLKGIKAGQKKRDDDEEEEEEDDYDEEEVRKLARDSDDEDMLGGFVSDDSEDEEEDEDLEDFDVTDEEDEEGGINFDDSEDDEEEEEDKVDRKRVSFSDKPSASASAPSSSLLGSHQKSSATAAIPEGKYVPPQRRQRENGGSSSSSSDSGSSLPPIDERLKRQLRGYLNRISAQNLLHFSKEIQEVYQQNPRSEVTRGILEAILDDCSNRGELLESFALLYSALISVLHCEVGTEIGAKLMEDVVIRFHSAYQKKEPKLTSNFLFLLCHMCNFQIIHPVLIFDLLNLMLSNFQELDIELTLLVLKACGLTLRSEDARGLKDIVIQVQQKAKGVTTSQNTTKGTDAGSTGGVFSARVLFMLDAINDLKDNRQKIVQTNTQFEQLRKAMKGLDKASSMLRVSLQDILEAETRGRWWVVGSAWIGHRSDVVSSHNARKAKEAKEEDDEILQLAKKNHMNTDVRRSIFCVLMTSEDYLDAFEKLLKLGLKGKQDREIVHVILHCAGKEKAFNPYYLHLAQKLCSQDHNSKITFQFAFWDKFKLLNGGSNSLSLDLVELSNMAKMLANMIGSGVLSLAIMKAFDYERLEAKPLLFLRIFFTELFTKYDENAIISIFKRITRVHLQEHNHHRNKKKEDEMDHGTRLEFEYQELQDRLLFLFKLKGFSTISQNNPTILARMKTARTVLRTFGGTSF